ncbi:hypothetical protein MXB_611 [Myxobolus squamalis]|nr:hypothetical protein MXB_611 [Myxobolus squamalis]
MSQQILRGKVALITGGSRGIGKGIAQVLVKEGATVYITVMQTADELNSMNKGKCIGVFCDHKFDSETQSVFDMIEINEKKIDILVNNVFGGLDDFVTVWEKTIDVGLRSAYIASCMALKMMIPLKSGLIVNISSIGGAVSLFNPIYGVGKQD